MATIDELHAQSVGQDTSGLMGKLVGILRGVAGAVSPQADGPGARAIGGIRSMLPGSGTWDQETDRYNRAAAPSPLYSDDSRFGSIVKDPAKPWAPTEGATNREQAMALQMAIVGAMKKVNRQQFDKQGTLRADAVKQSDPGYLYHATNVDRANEIAQSRMKLHEPWEFTDQGSWPDGSTKPRAYFSPRAESVASFAPEEGPSVVLRTPEGKRFRRESGTGDVVTEKPISARNLEIATPEGWKALASIEAEAAKQLREPVKIVSAPEVAPKPESVGGVVFSYHNDARKAITAALNKLGIKNKNYQSKASMRGYDARDKDPTPRFQLDLTKEQWKKFDELLGDASGIEIYHD